MFAPPVDVFTDEGLDGFRSKQAATEADRIKQYVTNFLLQLAAKPAADRDTKTHLGEFRIGRGSSSGNAA